MLCWRQVTWCFEVDISGPFQQNSAVAFSNWNRWGTEKTSLFLKYLTSFLYALSLKCFFLYPENASLFCFSCQNKTLKNKRRIIYDFCWGERIICRRREREEWRKVNVAYFPKEDNKTLLLLRMLLLEVPVVQNIRFQPTPNCSLLHVASVRCVKSLDSPSEDYCWNHRRK